MNGDLLLATDGRERTDLAADYAIALADHLDTGLSVLYVIDERLVEGVTDEETQVSLEEELESLGRSIIDDVIERSGDVAIDASIRRGLPHQEIIEAADAGGLIILGRDIAADTGESTATRVITRAEAPVLSVPLQAEEAPSKPLRSVLVPTDGSQYPLRALSDALEWIDPDEGKVHGLYVVDSSVYDLADAPRSIIGILREGGEAALADLATQIDLPSVTFRRHIRRGSVTPVILEATKEFDPDIVALGSRGRTTGSDPILGSTTKALLEQAAVPLLMAS